MEGPVPRRGLEDGPLPVGAAEALPERAVEQRRAAGGRVTGEEREHADRLLTRWGTLAIIVSRPVPRLEPRPIRPEAERTRPSGGPVAQRVTSQGRDATPRLPDEMPTTAYGLGRDRRSGITLVPQCYAPQDA